MPGNTNREPALSAQRGAPKGVGRKGQSPYPQARRIEHRVRDGGNRGTGCRFARAERRGVRMVEDDDLRAALEVMR